MWSSFHSARSLAAFVACLSSLSFSFRSCRTSFLKFDVDFGLETLAFSEVSSALSSGAPAFSFCLWVVVTMVRWSVISGEVIVSCRNLTELLARAFESLLFRQGLLVSRWSNVLLCAWPLMTLMRTMWLLLLGSWRQRLGVFELVGRVFSVSCCIIRFFLFLVSVRSFRTDSYHR